MNVERGLFWAPRVLGILFALFVSSFAQDVVGEGYGFWGTILALTMHLIPTMIILAALVIAWRWEAVGGILFIALGVFYALETWFRTQLPWSTYVVIAGPLFLIGGLFLADWAYRAKLRHSH